MAFFETDINPKLLSPLNLAFIGDCVYEMLVREMLIVEANRPVNDLHRESVKYVSAKAQTAAYDKIRDALTEEETAIYKRGRNAKVNSASKHSTLSDYHAATGMEALFGWLYLKGKQERINELFTLIINTITD